MTKQREWSGLSIRSGLLLFLLLAFTWNNAHAQCTLPATGQTQCYDTSGEVECPVPGFPGQDAETAYNSLSFTLVSTVSGQPTIRDNNTGLEWTQELFGPMNWQEALQFCDTLHWGGYDDWRLPNAKELQSIVDYGRYFPAMDPVFNYEHRLRVSWTSTTSSLNVKAGMSESAADAIGLRIGDLGQRSKYEENSVRPVRGCLDGPSCSLPATGQHSCFDNDSSEPCPVAGFPNQDGENIYNEMTYVLDSAVPGQETIHDSVTSLEWSQHVWENVTWQEALQLCDTLQWGGHEDWRMPNLKELQSLSDYQGNLEIDGIFEDTRHYHYWSSTTYAYSPTDAWRHSYNEYAWYGYQPKTSEGEVRPVRWCEDAPVDTGSTSWGDIKKKFR